MKVCVLASFIYGLDTSTAVLPGPNERVTGSTFGSFVGGRGFNQAVAARRAGAQVVVVGRVGDDRFGDEFRQSLHAEGIVLDHLAVDASGGTGVATSVCVRGRGRATIVLPRANHQLTRHDVDRAESAIASADVLIVQLEVPMQVVGAAMAAARRSGTLVVLRPAPVQAMAAGFLEMADILVCTESELRSVAGAATGERTEDVATDFWGNRAGGLLVTMGAAGTLVVERGAMSWIEPARMTEADSTGAGDILTGNLGARLAAGDRFGEAAARASQATTLSRTPLTTHPPDGGAAR